MAPSAGPEAPRPAVERVERKSVDELLDRAVKGRVCVIIGAAGWGKSTAVATWSRGRPTVWLRYEDHRGDADRLLASLFGALRAQLSVPTLVAGAAATDADQAGPSVEAICAWLGDVLTKDLILVLDDLHGLAPNSDAVAIVEGLCQRAPDQLRLILISRSKLPFSLQRLWGRGLVTEVQAPDLAFGIADIEALLRKTVGWDPPGLSRRVWEHTGGWPTAVQCAVEMLRAVEPDQRLAAAGQLSDPGQRFHDYLAEEVIGGAPEGIQRLIRRLAVFGEIRCMTEVAAGLDDPTTALTELSRQGLVRRTGENGWSLVSPLRDFFAHGSVMPSSERRSLYVTAAGECLARGAPAEALRYLLAADDYAACASILVDQGDAMVERGELDAVLDAAELPAEYLDDPRIQRVLGEALQVQGQWTQALQCFQRVGQGRDRLEPGLSWRVGLIAFAKGEFAEVQSLIRRTRLDREETLDEIRVLTLSASAYRMTGDLVGLRRMAVRARAAVRRCGDLRAWSSVHHVFAVLAAAEGNWRQAYAHYTDALHSAEASDDLLRRMWIWASRAFHQFEMGAPRQALADCQVVLSLSERCYDPFVVAGTLTTRGRVCARVGRLDEAADNFATAIDLFQRLGSRFLAWPLCGLGDLYRTRGQLVRARAAYEEALTLAEPCHDVFSLSSALIGLARIAAADDLQVARLHAARAVELSEGEGLRKIPALLARGWVELMGGDRQGASGDANRASLAARQRRDNPGLAEAITLGVLASRAPAVGGSPLREAIDIWQETGCRLEEAATRIVAGRIGAPIPRIDAEFADQMLRDQGVDVESRRIAGPLGILVISAPAVFIQALGVFRVVRYGAPIVWKSKKARDLLKILVARRRPTPRDQLMELLWPEVEPAVAGNRLSVLLSTLRDVLLPYPGGEDPLATTDGAVSLNHAQVSVDVENFLAQAIAALNADRANEPGATARLEAAVTAHTGDFLEDDPYQEWAATIVEEIRATHIALLRVLTVRLREAGDIDTAVRYALRLLEQDHYDEETHLTLVKTLLDAGRLGQARHHYNNYVRRMAEIDVSPYPLPGMTRRRAVPG